MRKPETPFRSVGEIRNSKKEEISRHVEMGGKLAEEEQETENKRETAIL